MTTTSAIVVTYQTGQRLKECLYALVSDPDIQDVILVDNGNPSDMMIWLERFTSKHDAVKLVSGQGNIGFGVAVNLGAKQASGEHLLIINPDAVLRRSSVSALQEAAEGLAEPWIVGGRIFDLRGREERGPRRRKLTLWRALTSFLGFNTWTLEQTPAPENPIPVDVISGAFFMMSKTGYQALNGFDEGYFLHVEDVDLCWRCWEAGGQVIYQPDAGALHYGATSDVPDKTVARHKADGLARYFRKTATGPFHRLCIELALPFIRFALLVKARD
jgi:hypothetical protein